MEKSTLNVIFKSGSYQKSVKKLVKKQVKKGQKTHMSKSLSENLSNKYVKISFKNDLLVESN